MIKLLFIMFLHRNNLLNECNDEMALRLNKSSFDVIESNLSNKIQNQRSICFIRRKGNNKISISPRDGTVNFT